MQNISKNLKQIIMKKIEKYVVFKYEDEFGFHYMKIDKLPGEGPTYTEPISFEKKINPNCSPAHVTALVRLLSGLKCRINLIRFHAIPDAPMQGADEANSFITIPCRPKNIKQWVC